MYIFFYLILIDEKQLKIGLLAWIASLSLIVLILFLRQFNFFQLNKNYLRIKNHINFWKNDIYKIGDIREVTFESKSKAPYFAKIVFKDYTIKRYYAATLGTGKWKELQLALEKLNIKVTNKL